MAAQPSPASSQAMGGFLKERNVASIHRAIRVYHEERCRVWSGGESVPAPLIALAAALAGILLVAPPLTAERAAPRETVDEPHEVNRLGRDIVECSSDRRQVVAVHYYFPEGHDPKWLLLDVAMDVRSGDPIKVARRDFSIEGPDGLHVPLTTRPAFRLAHRALRPNCFRCNCSSTRSLWILSEATFRAATVPTTTSGSS